MAANAKAIRALAVDAGYGMQQQTYAVAALTDQASGGRCTTPAEARALLDLIGDLRRAAFAAGWLDDREAGTGAA